MTHSTYMAHYVAAKIKTKPSEKPKSSLLPILLVVAVLLCLAGRAQTMLIPNDTSKFFMLPVINDGVSKYQGSKMDTVPVVMMVSDTAENKHQTQSYFNLNEYSPRKKNSFSILDVMDGQLVEIATPIHYQPYIIYGYQVTESYTHVVDKKHITTQFYICNVCTQYKTTYINHLKQPLPERLIVWMAVRRKER